MSHALKLGVNIDHVATLRQARHTLYPDPVDAARICAEAGAHSITVHLREDRRHIQDRDVEILCRERMLPINLEMGNHPEIVDIALKLKPDEICLVPERRQELTTEGGLNVTGQFDVLRETVERMSDAGIIVSLFIDPDPAQIKASALTGAAYIELHTGTFCDHHDEQELNRLIEGARMASQYGLKVNAGHGINLENIQDILRLPHLDVLNIGHSIVSRAVLHGMKAAVTEMIEAMKSYRGGALSP